MGNLEKLEENKETVLSLCICSSCLSWEHGEGSAFCLTSISKSNPSKEEKGCICEVCPVREKFGLKHDYYCIRGSEEEQSS